MKKFQLFFLMVFAAFNLQAQVGLNTDNPEAALDIASTTSGLLIPRVALTGVNDNTTVKTPDGLVAKVSTLVFNDGTGGLEPVGFYYWQDDNWLQFVTSKPQVYTGKFQINSSGSITIAGVPFEPKSISFEAYANVETYTLNSDNGVGNNNRSAQNSFGYTFGYAKLEEGAISQQVINGGGSADNIDNLSRYSSSTKCIGIRYVSGKGVSYGLTTATLTSFNADGFDLDVDNYTDGLVVVFTAYKY